MSRVRIVTDSSAGIPEKLLAAQDVSVVPLSVTAGRKIGSEGVDVTAADVLSALSERPAHVGSSQPPPEAFRRAYAGGGDVASIHLSGALSGTCQVAERVAGDEPGRVRVIDSRSIAMGLGFVVLAAADAAQAGGDLYEVVEAANTAITATRVLFYVDTLEFLRRGGRIGPAAARLGTALAVKPLLHLDSGVIGVRGRVRTPGRALAKLEELAVNDAAGAPVRVAVMHLGAPDRADALADRLVDRLTVEGELTISELSAAVGVHTGPGVVGVALCPAR